MTYSLDHLCTLNSGTGTSHVFFRRLNVDQVTDVQTENSAYDPTVHKHWCAPKQYVGIDQMH